MPKKSKSILQTVILDTAYSVSPVKAASDPKTRDSAVKLFQGVSSLFNESNKADMQNIIAGNGSISGKSDTFKKLVASTINFGTVNDAMKLLTK